MRDGRYHFRSINDFYDIIGEKWSRREIKFIYLFISVKDLEVYIRIHWFLKL